MLCIQYIKNFHLTKFSCSVGGHLTYKGIQVDEYFDGKVMRRFFMEMKDLRLESTDMEKIFLTLR